ncbi:TIGR01621 family pseudouridine synthase [Glaciecola siphonariae]|uniref:TIGR01621 family pseudouridine synthase n=1 Tax=Glaciecola siphonariae TaxID=521012 RepID=A0ABV9LWJ9_9ALTE
MTLPIPGSVPVVFEHSDFIVVDKPVGVPMHDAQQGITSVLTQQDPNHQWHLVHRLDTATSGLLIVAKHKNSASALSELFAQRRIEKYYIALSDNKPKKKQGLVKGDMQKARGGSYKLSTSLKNPAITQFYSCSHSPGIRAFLLKPHTGKTHQIRVALKSQGAAILGDERYGGSDADRMYLCSYALRFMYEQQPIEVIHLSKHGALLHDFELPAQWQQPWIMPWPPL